MANRVRQFMNIFKFRVKKAVRRFPQISVFAIAPFICARASAWDGALTTSIRQIDVTDGGNYAFRVYGTQPMCGTDSPNWVYMNADWNNYQATAALLTSSWLAGKHVTIYSVKNVSGNCRVGYVIPIVG